MSALDEIKKQNAAIQGKKSLYCVLTAYVRIIFLISTQRA